MACGCARLVYDHGVVADWSDLYPRAVLWMTSAVFPAGASEGVVITMVGVTTGMRWVSVKRLLGAGMLAQVCWDALLIGILLWSWCWRCGE